LPQIMVVVPYDVVLPYSIMVEPAKSVFQTMRADVDERTVVCKKVIVIELVLNVASTP